jgi:hypothetical protein
MVRGDDMHAIYTRLIELIEKDPNNIDELEDWINSALELSDSEEECMALTNAVTHAKKELLLIDLSKHLLGVTDDKKDTSVEDYKSTQFSLREAMRQRAEVDSKIHLTKTQLEMLYNRYENEQKRISHELTNDRF